MHGMRVSSFLIFFFLLQASCSPSAKLPPLGQEQSILAFGDSLTFGTGASPTESYPAQLSRMVNRKVVNAGIPGETSAEGLSRLPEILDREQPALLLLCHGANDLLRHMSREDAAANLRSMVQIAQERGIGVVLISVPAPDLSLSPPPYYQEIAAEFNLPCEGKILKKVLSKRDLKSDYVHPNGKGYAKIAEAVADLLKKSGAL